MSMCGPCPWRDMKSMRAEFPDAVAHAEAGHTEGFMCHKRCIPCPGPALALDKERKMRERATS